MKERFWDIFYRGRSVGMSKGNTLEEAKQLVKESLPHIHEEIKYAEWFGRYHPDNCKTSGGNRPNPV